MLGPLGTALGCAMRVKEGAVPNEHGTWLYGRGGWCDGLQVNPWRVDVTKQVGSSPPSFSFHPLNIYEMPDLKLLLIWNPQQNHPKMLFSHSKQTTGNRAMLYSFLTQQNCCLKKSLRISCFLRTDVAIIDLIHFCVSFLVVSTITKGNQNCLKAGESSKRMHSCTRLNILLCSFPAQCWHYWPLIEKLCMTDSSK